MNITNKAYVVEHRPSAVLTKSYINPLDTRTVRYEVTVDGVSIIGWRTRSAAAAWKEASKIVFREDNPWRSRRRR